MLGTRPRRAPARDSKAFGRHQLDNACERQRLAGRGLLSDLDRELEIALGSATVVRLGEALGAEQLVLELGRVSGGKRVPVAGSVGRPLDEGASGRLGGRSQLLRERRGCPSGRSRRPGARARSGRSAASAVWSTCRRRLRRGSGRGRRACARGSRRPGRQCRARSRSSGRRRCGLRSRRHVPARAGSLAIPCVPPTRRASAQSRRPAASPTRR